MFRALQVVVLLFGSAGCEDPDRPSGKVPAPSCLDADGDGFGVYCQDGPDCDESNPAVHFGCGSCGSRPQAGCPCEADRVVECYSQDPVLDENGKEVCMAGERRCIDGAWGTCEYTESFDVPEDREVPR